MHGPGGESYYAAIWANDQAEYINPFFPFVGYEYGNASALNSYLHFARFMNDEWKPIPSSIIAEGIDIWNGASIQFSSVAQSCPTLCDPMSCSMPGLPVHYQLLEFTQTHVIRWT